MVSSRNARLKLAFKIFWRDWKTGELNLLVASLLLAIATVTSISLFTSRIHNAIYQEAAHFLAADAKISGSLPMPTQWQEHAQTQGLQTASLIGFQAMAFAADGMVLTQVKGVSDSYPLKGELGISERPFTDSRAVSKGPPSGEAWLAPRLFGALGISSGDNITIGEASFRVSASLNREPDSGQSLFGVAPRVMINQADVAKTEAIQTGSRVSYALLVSGEASDLARFENWLQPQLGNHHRWTGVKSENRGVGDALTRAERFLLLTGCLSVVLSGVAIALAARRYATRQQNQVAILKTLGSSPTHILGFYAVNLALIGIFCLALGAMAGWLLHWGIMLALGDLLPADIAAPSWSAYTTGGVTGVVALWAFAAPPIIALRNIAPASILREQVGSVLSSRLSFAIGAAAVVLLMGFYSRDLSLTLIVAAGASLCLLGVGVLGAGLIYACKRVGQKLDYSWRLGLANLQRHQRFNALQIMVFSVLLMLLFILLTVRTSLIQQWQNQLPEDAPNHFAFNIFPDEAAQIREFFDANGIAVRPFYPMTRGRLTQINEEDAQARIELKSNDLNYERELNLTWSDTYGEDNKIIAGTWWQNSDDTQPLLVSAEEEYAKGIDLKVGDSVTFSVAGTEVSAKVANLRSVQWDSMNPNFFMIFNREIVPGSGANWITSFHLASQQKSLLNILSRKFPTISLIEIDQTIEQIQSIIGKVSMAIEFILLLVLVSGILVLVTSVQATLDLRIRESAIFRTLGANRRLIQKVLLIEFCMLGLLAGILAVAGTELCLFFLQTRVFNLAYQSQFSLWLWGPLVSALLIGAVGWLSTRRVIITPPLAVLRQT